jgi:lipopolysaccharide/colanic/teichoic acid biosynthesis glycosyltransferase
LRGPVFFGQRRIGVGDLPFTMLKFRTMGEDAERRSTSRASQPPRGQAATAYSNPGRSARDPLRPSRRYELDELPQLWNVLKGEMSPSGLGL